MKTLLFAMLVVPGNYLACLNSGHHRVVEHNVNPHLVTHLRKVMAMNSRDVKAVDKFGRARTPVQMRELQALDLIVARAPAFRETA
jgi:hypothetical protein